MSKFVKRYNNYIKRKGLKHNDKNLNKFKQSSKKDTNLITNYEYGKTGHMKSDCPTLLKKKSKAPSKLNLEGKCQRAYIAWEEEDKSLIRKALSINRCPTYVS